ncbi:MAG: LPS export ABC transporter periplasmic protein LptC [Candidatus Binataceae bacterium]
MSPRRIAKALALCGSVAVAAILIVTVWVVRHRSPGQTLQRAAGMMPGALLHAHNFHWTQMKGGQRQWVLTARDANYAAGKTSMVLKDARLSLLQNGKQTQLTAPEVDLKMNGNHVTRADLHGGITVNYGSYVLTTPDATFLPDRDQLSAPGPVKIVGDGMTVTGIGLSGNPRTENFNLLAQVNTRITPRQKDANPKAL